MAKAKKKKQGGKPRRASRSRSAAPKNSAKATKAKGARQAKRPRSARKSSRSGRTATPPPTPATGPTSPASAAFPTTPPPPPATAPHAKPAAPAWVAPNMPYITPYLTVQDGRRALEFYRAAFGFELEARTTDDDGNILHAEMKWHDARFMFAPEGEWGGKALAPSSSANAVPVSLYVYCSDVDAICASAEAAGAEILVRPTTMRWDDRICQLLDPDGHRWTFATYIGKA